MLLLHLLIIFNIMSLVRPATRGYKVCEDSLRWVLNYRNHIREGQAPQNMASLLDADGHNGSSYSWTKYQAEIIEIKGLNHWLDMTDGPRGYAHWLDHRLGLRGKTPDP